MYCPNCGEELCEGAKFCPVCGQPVPELSEGGRLELEGKRQDPDQIKIEKNDNIPDANGQPVQAQNKKKTLKPFTIFGSIISMILIVAMIIFMVMLWTGRLDKFGESIGIGVANNSTADYKPDTRIEDVEEYSYDNDESDLKTDTEIDEYADIYQEIIDAYSDESGAEYDSAAEDIYSAPITEISGYWEGDGVFINVSIYTSFDDGDEIGSGTLEGAGSLPFTLHYIDPMNASIVTEYDTYYLRVENGQLYFMASPDGDMKPLIYKEI